jgi:hypothetical protein
MGKKRYPRYIYNKISLIGLYIAIGTGLVLLLSLVAQARLGATNPYMGIFVYMVLPPFIVLGMAMVPIGMLRRWRRMKKYGEEEVPQWPYIDLNKPTHRNIVAFFGIGSILFAALVVFGGYHAFHYTESVAFCGTTCHTVMKPEDVAYQNSAHARVPCTACHVGAGADWYAKSKLSGAYQVYAVIANVFPRPIPTPISNLRPAQETCEQCHWPRKFFGGQQRVFNHYKYDEKNTPWPINILIKTGGGDPKTGQTTGIHWHMNIESQVEYIARDERRQDIPWIKVRERRTGRVTVYQDVDNPLTKEELATLKPRKMDCMDCHNRPSHKYHSPDFMVDKAILTNRIAQDLPDIKRIAVEAMAKEYDTEEAAHVGIANYITNAYKEDYPDAYGDRLPDIQQAILTTQTQFSQSIFPEMKVRWDEYPDNIGHLIYPGCMRCHDGKKVSEEGWTLTRKCTTCHTILSQGSGDSYQASASEEGLEFVHPEDIGEEWRETGCYECHDGTQP